MPTHDLMEVLKRLHGEAEQVLLESGTERESRGGDAKTNERFQLGPRRLRGSARRPRPAREVSEHERGEAKEAPAPG